MSPFISVRVIRSDMGWVVRTDERRRCHERGNCLVHDSVCHVQFKFLPSRRWIPSTSQNPQIIGIESSTATHTKWTDRVLGILTSDQLDAVHNRYSNTLDPARCLISLDICCFRTEGGADSLDKAKRDTAHDHGLAHPSRTFDQHDIYVQCFVWYVIAFTLTDNERRVDETRINWTLVLMRPWTGRRWA